ncbi:MAG: hypothetical protein J6M07_07095, partial [Ruminococcus sp.]|nr:hypothetical protein [Ruminococcus sp.]
IQIITFNDDLTVACQPILIADKSLNIDFVFPDTNKVLIRAEICTDSFHGRSSFRISGFVRNAMEQITA